MTTERIPRGRVWTVADFAKHARMKHRPARRFLKKLNEKHGGKLLIPSDGTNREFRLYPAILARLEPDLFTPIESLELRVDEVEEAVGQLHADKRRIVAAIGQHSRDIAALQRRHRAA